MPGGYYYVDLFRSVTECSMCYTVSIHYILHHVAKFIKIPSQISGFIIF